MSPTVSALFFTDRFTCSSAGFLSISRLTSVFSIGSETLVFGEIQNDGLAVDAKADVFDGVVATVSERFCLDSA